MSQRDQVQKGLQHLKGSDEIIGNIISYCVNAYKVDPSQKTINKIRQYVSDTATSVSEHILTIAHNLNRMIDHEAKEIEEMTTQTGYVAHRLLNHQNYMSELYMTKFEITPRPRKTLHVLRQTIPISHLPKYARPKKPWKRQTEFNYSILDQVAAKGAKQNINPRRQRQQKKQIEQKQDNIKKPDIDYVNPTAHVAALDITQVASSPSQSSTLTNEPRLFSKKKKSRLNLGNTVSPSQNNQPPPTFSSKPLAAPPSFSGKKIVTEPPPMMGGGNLKQGPPLPNSNRGHGRGGNPRGRGRGRGRGKNQRKGGPPLPNNNNDNNAGPPVPPVLPNNNDNNNAGPPPIPPVPPVPPVSANNNVPPKPPKPPQPPQPPSF